MGDPVVGEAEASTVDLKVAPEASTRDEACTLGSTLLSTKVLALAPLVAMASSFGGMVTVPLACAVAAMATLAGLRLGSISTEVLVAALSAETFGKLVAAAAAMALVGATGGLVNAALVDRTPSFGGMLPAAAVATTVASLRFRSSILSFAADDMVDAMREEPFLALRVTGMILDRSS